MIQQWKTFQHIYLRDERNNKNVRKGGMTLRTFSVLKGMPVFTIKGERIGTVHDLSISEAGQVTGLVIHQQALFKRSFHLTLDDISSYGPDGIVIIQQESTPKKVPDNSIWLTKDEVLGRMLLSEMGEELGLLQDVYFREKMGTIIAYETTDGFFSETTVIESKQPPTLGKDTIIVSVYEQ
ncbi:MULTISPECIES: PRC-barrel domain-containing protein [unclassified Peribacillus]|uniref:PRC-barrel domain-containing protein n=1 Tax=unclassified Peribacillus TaxID=2675266 RepID=UPI001F5BC57C|nr:MULTISPECIES: PRC-barrel domain-containing protein [unclassified Peribacillus]WMX54239.1 PRC-barrel domain-containing protein [Peribacillus sp. R9-11]